MILRTTKRTISTLFFIATTTILTKYAVSFRIGEKQYTSLEAKMENGKSRIPGIAEISWEIKENG